MPLAAQPIPVWLHRWAVFTACATFILLTLGAIVTTFQAGMADPIPVTYPWHLLLVPWQNAEARFFIEHSHRLAAYMIGCCVILLAVGLWMRQSRRWLRVLGAAALVGVMVQGFIGSLRVELNRRYGVDLALIHGSFASLVFALLVSLAIVTSPRWNAPAVNPATSLKMLRLRRWSMIAAGFVLLQIVLGGFLRHTYSSLGQRGHLLIAFAVMAAVACLAKDYFDQPFRNRRLTNNVLLFVVLVVCQLLLGVETWMLKYFGSAAPAVQALTRTTHVLLGYLTFATAVVVALEVRRNTVTAAATPAAPMGNLEGAA
jgi:cytochrome c oxidase assembly protein subunit 15